MIEAAQDYAKYFEKLDISKELIPINQSVDGMLKRLDELEGLMNILKNDASTTTQQNLPAIFASQDNFRKLCKNIDNLSLFVNIVSENMDELEQQVLLAEDELGINDSGIRGLLKPLFSKSKKKSDSEDDVNKPYVPLEIFKSADYFPNASDTGLADDDGDNCVAGAEEK